MFYPDQVVEEVRRSNDVVDVISEYVKLTQKGNSHTGLCPFHNEKTPSFHVSRDKQIYHCFGCGAGGNVISFIMNIENISFVDALKLLAKRSGITLPEAEISKEAQEKIKQMDKLYKINVEAAKYFYRNLKSEYGKRGRDYLEKRQLTENTIKSFGLGYSLNFKDDLYKYLKGKGYKEQDIEKLGLIIKSNNNNYHDRFWDRVMYPIFDVHDKVIGFGGRILENGEPKYLNSSESDVFNKRMNLYALNFAKKSRKNDFIMVEGYMDVISLHQAGFTNAVASLGTALTKEQAFLIRRYATDVVIIYDSDNAGTAAALRAIPILKSAGLTVRVLQVIDAKDPDEYIKKFGREAFEELLKTAMDYADFQIKITKKQFDINKHEEKIKAIKKLIEYINGLDDELEKQMYMKKIAKEFSLDEKVVEGQVGKKVPEITVKPKKVEQTENKNIPSAYEKSERLLLSFMLEKRKIYDKVLELFEKNIFIVDFHRKVFENMKKLYETTNNSDVAKFIDYFPELEEQKKVNTIISEIELYEEKEREKLLNQQIKIVGNKVIDSEVEIINNAIKTLDDDDKTALEKKLSQILMKKININKANIKYE